MLRLVVFGEAVIRRENLGRNNEVVVGCIEGPNVRTKNYNGEVDVHVIMILHTRLKLISKVFAETHVYGKHVSDQNVIDVV